MLAVIVGVSGSHSYQVALENSCLWHCLIDQLWGWVVDLRFLNAPLTVTPKIEHSSNDIDPQQPAAQMKNLPGKFKQDSVPLVPLPGSSGRLLATASTPASEPGTGNSGLVAAPANHP